MVTLRWKLIGPLGLTLGLLALTAFNIFARLNLLGEDVPKWVVVVLATCSVVVIASIRPSFKSRVLMAFGLAVAAWLIFAADGMVLLLFEPPWESEGGPIAWLLITGFYLGLPIAVLGPLVVAILPRSVSGALRGKV